MVKNNCLQSVGRSSEHFWQENIGYSSFMFIDIAFEIEYFVFELI